MDIGYVQTERCFAEGLEKGDGTIPFSDGLLAQI
jgi:hypothetical protein